MELEDMKKEWSALTATVQSQKLLTNQLIKDMTQTRYAQKFSTLMLFESIGAGICVITALLILSSLPALHTWYFLGSGILIASYLIFLPWMTLQSLFALKKIPKLELNYKETILRYTKRKKRVLLIQRFGLISNFFIVLLGIPLAHRLFKGKDMYLHFTSLDSWELKSGMIVVFLIGLFYFSKWGYRCYQGITKGAEEILQELKD